MVPRFVAGAVALAGLLTAGRGVAQDHMFSVTGYAGSAGYGDLAAGQDPGVLLAPGGFYGVQAELWLGWFGARLHSGFGDAGLEADPTTGFGILAIDADFLARFRRPRPGQFFQPYGALGFGVVRYSTGTDATTVAGYDYGRDPENRASMVLAVGADFLGGPLALRMELMDIIGFSTPLGPGDGTTFGPVSHAVLTFGLSFRLGRFRLPPETDRPRPRPRPRPAPTRTEPPRDTMAPPPDDTAATPDTTATDTAAADTVRVRPPPPAPPPVDTTVSVDTIPPPQPPPQPPDTTRRPPIRPPIDTTRMPPRRDSMLEPPRRPPVQPPRPPPVDTTVSVDTTAPPRRPPRDSMIQPPEREPPRRRPGHTRPPTDTTGAPTDTTEAPTDTTETPTDTTDTPTDTTETPTDTTDTGDGEGRLFTVRVSWDPGDEVDAAAIDTLVAILEAAGVPVWPIESDPGGGGQGRGRGGGQDPGADASHRRVAALRNASHARTLGNHVEGEYGLAWEWVHIPMDEDVPEEDVEASTAFVESLDEGPGEGGRGGRGGGGPPGGDGSRG